MSDANRREEAIFEDALELADAGRRKLFLDQACGQDARLRARIEKLIAVHEQAERFFKDCLPGPGPQRETRAGSTESNSTAGAAFCHEICG